MEHDCSIQQDNKQFRMRTGAFIICNGKMLFVRCGVSDHYLYMVGGATHMGESTIKCIEREVFEETGLDLKVSRLAVICENFFYGKGGNIDGKDCHSLEFYYILEKKETFISSCKQVSDSGEELVWLPIEEISKANIKPAFLKTRIFEILNSDHIIHIVNDER